jgi:hypothetical protein
MHVLISGRSLAPEDSSVITPNKLYPLTSREEVVQNPDGAGVQPGAALSVGSLSRLRIMHTLD